MIGQQFCFYLNRCDFRLMCNRRAILRYSRRLVVQRTKLVDQTQEKLLELLEDMTTGTEEETRNFMAVCVDTIGKYPPDDQLTPVFIFERLCNLIYPEEADTGEFFMTLEKDPQQEDFLQVNKREGFIGRLENYQALLW